MEMDLDEDEDDTRNRKKTKTEALDVETKDILKTALTILLEPDDSTRRIIAALLRKCTYRVSAVPDALKAWEILKGRRHNVDLILTEVDLPSISGYALLTLVMGHDICKNIPVIMMSSCDKVSMVLNCMLKGAADFLIKPIRKNELKNLWQHVWRRHTKISGKFPMNLTVGQSQVEGTSDNDEAGNYSSDCEASRKKIMECSEKGSYAQNSCTTPYLEAESRCMQNMQDLAVLKDVTAPNLNMSNKKLGFSAYMDKEYDILKSNITEKLDNAAKSEASDSVPSRMIEDCAFAEIRSHNVVVRPDVYRVVADGACEMNDYSNKGTKLSSGLIENGHALNHSNASAFSSYNSCKMMKSPSLTQPNAPTKSDTSASESPRPLPSLLSENSGCTYQEHGISARNSWNNMSRKVAGGFDKAEHQIVQTQLGLHNHSMFYTRSIFPPMPEQSDAAFGNCHDISNPRKVEYQYVENTYNCIERVDEELKHDSPSASHGASSLCNGRDHVNSNTYGSICSQTEGNTLSTAVIDETAASRNMNSTYFFTNEGYKGLDSSRFRHREAAVEKFRLKRKDRCFEKKVRYQNRKRLAEQRPRVKGQFVRQRPSDPPASASCQ